MLFQIGQQLLDRCGLAAIGDLVQEIRDHPLARRGLQLVGHLCL